MFLRVILLAVLTLPLLAACNQTVETPSPEGQALLDDTVMLRMALHFGWSPRPYIDIVGLPTEVRASQVISYEEAVKLKGGTLYPDTGDYQRKDELVRLYVFRGDISGLHYEIPEGGGPLTWVSTKIAQLFEIVNASTGQGMGSSGRYFEAELDVSMLEVVEIPDDIYLIVPVTIAPQPPVTAAPAATPAPKPPEETPTPTAAPTQTPSPWTTPRGCSEREEVPPCGLGVETGKPYPFTLYTHCGVRSAYFDGRRWIADPVLSVDSVNPPPGWGNPYDQGMMELIAEDLALYTSESRMVAEFRPLPDGEDYPFGACA